MIVVVSPFDKLDANLMQSGEKDLDLRLISKPAVETFDEPILYRLSPVKVNRVKQFLPPFRSKIVAAAPLQAESTLHYSQAIRDRRTEVRSIWASTSIQKDPLSGCNRGPGLLLERGARRATREGLASVACSKSMVRSPTWTSV